MKELILYFYGYIVFFLQHGAYHFIRDTHGAGRDGHFA